MPEDKDEHRLANLNRFLEREIVKVLLSALIIISVLPEQILTAYLASRLAAVFFLVFAFELGIRMAVFIRTFKEGKAGVADIVLLFFDLIATLSFLPVDLLYPPAKGLRFLRLFRLMRMFLLLRYWGSVGRDIWVILMKRRYQVLFAASVVLILSFVGGILVYNIEAYRAADQSAAHDGAQGFDYNDDGVVDNRDNRFSSILWWAFRQIQDPGNLVREPRGGAVLVLSVLLTIGGLFIISFVIGIGTNVVEELVHASRERPIGMRKHSAILNISRYSYLLLLELHKYYSKHFRKARIAVLGSDETRPDFLFRPELQRVRYRWGDGADVQGFRKVDADKANRIILLGDPGDEHSDARVVSQILAARQLNPDGWILAEVVHESNLRTAADVGGPKTVPIPLAKLEGLFLTNIVLFPGIEDTYEELLTSAGREIYTVLFGYSDVPALPPTARPARFGELFNIAFSHYDIVLLGVLLPSTRIDEGWTGVFKCDLNPEGDPLVDRGIEGFVALSAGFGELKAFASDFASGGLPSASALAERKAVPSFALSPESFYLEKILICNFSEGLIDFVEQLALFLKNIEIFVMLEDDSQVRRVTGMLVGHARRKLAQSDGKCGHFKSTGAKLAYHFAGQERPPVPVKIFVGDLDAETELPDSQIEGFTLRDMGAIVLTPSSRKECDPDAKTALSLLKLMNLHEREPGAFKPSFRLIAEIIDPEKACHLEEKAAASDLKRRTVTILSRERIRNEFLAQAIFVPGIVSIYMQLLSETGQEICRLLPDATGLDPAAVITYPDLLHGLYERDRLILLGVEIENPDSGRRELFLHPGPDQPGFRFRLGDLTAACAIGDTRRFERSRPRGLSRLGSPASNARGS